MEGGRFAAEGDRRLKHRHKAKADDRGRAGERACKSKRNPLGTNRSIPVHLGSGEVRWPEANQRDIAELGHYCMEEKGEGGREVRASAIFGAAAGRRRRFLDCSDGGRGRWLAGACSGGGGVAPPVKLQY